MPEEKEKLPNQLQRQHTDPNPSTHTIHSKLSTLPGTPTKRTVELGEACIELACAKKLSLAKDAGESPRVKLEHLWSCVRGDNVVVEGGTSNKAVPLEDPPANRGVTDRTCKQSQLWGWTCEKCTPQQIL